MALFCYQRTLRDDVRRISSISCGLHLWRMLDISRPAALRLPSTRSATCRHIRAVRSTAKDIRLWSTLLHLAERIRLRWLGARFRRRHIWRLLGMSLSSGASLRRVRKIVRAAVVKDAQELSPRNLRRSIAAYVTSACTGLAAIVAIGTSLRAYLLCRWSESHLPL